MKKESDRTPEDVERELIQKFDAMCNRAYQRIEQLAILDPEGAIKLAEEMMKKLILFVRRPEQN